MKVFTPPPESPLIFFLGQTDAICSTTMESSAVMFNPTAEVLFSVPPPVFRNIPPLSRSSCVFGTRRLRLILALSVHVDRCFYLLHHVHVPFLHFLLKPFSEFGDHLLVCSKLYLLAFLNSMKWKSWREKISLPTFYWRSKNLRPKRRVSWSQITEISILKFKRGSSFICMMQTKQIQKQLPTGSSPPFSERNTHGVSTPQYSIWKVSKCFKASQLSEVVTLILLHI